MGDRMPIVPICGKDVMGHPCLKARGHDADGEDPCLAIPGVSPLLPTLQASADHHLQRELHSTLWQRARRWFTRWFGAR